MSARGSDTFAWDGNNQLTSATVNGTTADYTYDGNGNRVSATTGGTTATYLWDESSGLPSLVADGANSYLSANGLQAAIDGSGTTSYALADALGSIRGLTDASGTLTGSTDYDAFGTIRNQTGTGLPLGFTGELTDPTTGFLDLRARDLDPSLGRFLSRDTVTPNAPGSQGYNPYAYVANNPTTWTDPSGQSAATGALSAPGVTGEMVAEAAMLIAIRSASILTAAVCALRLCTAGGVLLLFAVGVLICFLDVGSACWTEPIATASALARYGSTATAGAWDGSGTLIQRAPQSFPVLPALPYVAAGVTYLAKKVSDQAKSKRQKASERAVWDEASKGLSKAEKRRLHDLLEGIKGEMRNADPKDIIDERNTLFPDNPYPGGWLLP